jgi:flagellar biogenesis protein FliO
MQKKMFFLLIFIIVMIFSFTSNILSQNTDTSSTSTAPSDEESITKQINENLKGTGSADDRKNQEKTSFFSIFLRTAIILLVLIGIYLFFKYKYSKKSDKKLPDKIFNILFLQPVAKNISIGILEFFENYYIISIGSDINILEKVDNQELIDLIKLESSKKSEKKSFLEFLGLSSSSNIDDKKSVNQSFNNLKQKIGRIKKGNQQDE